MKNSVLSVLRHTEFRNIWLAQLGTVQGYMMIQVTVAWMMATLTTSPTLIALVQAALSAPIMLFSLIAGVFADSFDRRRVLQIAQAFIFTMVLVMAGIQMTGGMSAWVLLGLTFLIGTGLAVNNPSWQATIGDLVPREDIQSAVALNNIAHNLARSIGPAVSGVLLVVWSAAATLLLASLGYILMLVRLAAWKRPPRDTRLPREPFAAALLTGMRYAVIAPDILATIGRVMVFAFGSIAILAMLPVLVKSRPDGTALVYGLLLSSFGLGAMVGAFFNRAIHEKLGGEGMARLAFLVFGAMLVVVALADNFWIMGIALPFGGAAWVSGYTTFNSTVQLSTARWVVGRVMSIHQTGVFTGVTVGSAFVGLIADKTDPATALLVAAGILGAGAAIGLVRPIPGISQHDLDSSNRFHAPEPKADIDNRSGPVMVTISYKFAPEKLDAFLAAMAIRRQARRRDGARNWTLYQDVINPDVWLETYHVTNWAEYVRHNERQIKGDQHNLDELRQFLSDDPIHSVHRYVQRPPHRARLTSNAMQP